MNFIAVLHTQTILQMHQVLAHLYHTISCIFPLLCVSSLKTNLSCHSLLLLLHLTPGPHLLLPHPCSVCTLRSSLARPLLHVATSLPGGDEGVEKREDHKVLPPLPCPCCQSTLPSCLPLFSSLFNICVPQSLHFLRQTSTDKKHK